MTAPRTATSCVHTGVAKDDSFNSVTTPIYTSSTFSFIAPGVTAGPDYTRSGNPTRQSLEECLAELEGGAGCTATASGMAATTTAMHLLGANAHLVAGRELYGGSYRLFTKVLPERGIEVTFVDMRDVDEVRRALRPATRGIWIETPSNPLLNLVDLEAVCALAADRELISFVDNTFMTPLAQRPFDFGADVVVHSTTKYLNGHSDVVGGAVVCREAALAQRVAALANALGTTCSPFDAWLVRRGLKTLACRMAEHQRNAQAIAEYLVTRPEVEQVYYPGLPTHPQHALALKQMRGFGGMVCFDLRGGEERVFPFIKALRYFNWAGSLGGVESLIAHPPTMSHAAMDPAARAAAGIRSGNVRLSVGIEDIEDLLADLDRGFAALTP